MLLNRGYTVGTTNGWPTCFIFFGCRSNCPSTLWTAWDGLLQETEADAQSHADIAGVVSRAVSRPLLEKTFHMKIQSRKVFTHRESYETILSKTEEMLLKVRTNLLLSLGRWQGRWRRW